jgi:succinate dehydrogenase hydrophobic anchor subunit
VGSAGECGSTDTPDLVVCDHSYLGTNVIIEDYVTSTGTKVASLLLLRFAYVLVGGAAIFAILRMAFGFSRL